MNAKRRRHAKIVLAIIAALGIFYLEWRDLQTNNPFDLRFAVYILAVLCVGQLLEFLRDQKV